jgi:hypothetical protein
MPVPRVGQSDGMAEAIERGSRLEVGNVDDHGPAGPDDSRQLPHERRVVGDVLQVIHHHHLIERSILERRPGAVEAVHPLPHQLADRGDGALVQSALLHRPPMPTQQKTDDAVVGADVEAIPPFGASSSRVIWSSLACFRTERRKSGSAHPSRSAAA